MVDHIAKLQREIEEAERAVKVLGGVEHGHVVGRSLEFVWAGLTSVCCALIRGSTQAEYARERLWA
jgi:hypothetical protein